MFDMKIKLAEQYESGIEEIDKQHQNVILAVKKLYDACESSKGTEEILNLVNELDYYTTVHFNTEEDYAQKYDYPTSLFEQLKNSHDFFKTLYKEVRYHYHYYHDFYSMELEMPYQYALHLQAIMAEWLAFHINMVDKTLLDFLKEKILEGQISGE
jgi:hemerythrin